VWIRAPNGLEVKADKLTYRPFVSVTIGYVGENQKPGDMKNGMTQIIDKLYNSGYDAWIFDEDDPLFDKDFQSEMLRIDFDFSPFADPPDKSIKEVISAVTERGVTEVSIMGYSHGGGAAYVLADRLTREMPEGAMFSIPLTAYIDGVKKRSAFAEDRMPPETLAHYNVYHQRVGLLPARVTFIQGTSLPGSFVDDDVDAKGGPFFYPLPGKMHTNIAGLGIAEEREIQAHLIDEYMDRVTR
jgi:hypothetical protein